MALHSDDVDSPATTTTAPAVPRRRQAEVSGDLRPDSGDPAADVPRNVPHAAASAASGVPSADDHRDGGHSPAAHVTSPGDVLPFPTPSTTTTAPSGASGAPTPVRDYRDRRGRFAPGNSCALKVGEHSAAFWAGAQAAQHEIMTAVLRDLGHGDEASAPAAVTAVVRNLAQGVLLRDAAFSKIVEQGGPQTEPTSRARAALRIWAESADKVLAAAKVIGLARVPKPAPSLRAVLDAVEPASDV